MTRSPTEQCRAAGPLSLPSAGTRSASPTGRRRPGGPASPCEASIICTTVAFRRSTAACAGIAQTRGAPDLAAAADEREQTWRRPAAAGRRRLVFVRTGSEVGVEARARNPWQSISVGPSAADACFWAIATARQVCWAADSEQAQSRFAWPRAGPGDRRDLDHPVVAWPGVSVISSLPARALLPIVHCDSQRPARSCCCSPIRLRKLLARAGSFSGHSPNPLGERQRHQRGRSGYRRSSTATASVRPGRVAASPIRLRKRLPRAGSFSGHSPNPLGERQRHQRGRSGYRRSSFSAASDRLKGMLAFAGEAAAAVVARSSSEIEQTTTSRCVRRSVRVDGQERWP